MPIKHPQFVNGEIYHIVNRGVAGQKVFLDKKDYLRYLLSLYKFNDKGISANTHRLSTVREDFPNRRPPLGKKRERLIDFLGFCLMPNHIHLLIRQLVDRGVSLFFRKMGRRIYFC